MGPSPADLAIARQFSERLVAAGQGRIRRVVMIGSRARGTPGPESDLDLVVLVEISAAARPWANPEISAERRPLQDTVGRPPVPTDLWVRTTAQFEESRRVIGGVESLVESEGVDLFSRPFYRAPIVRRPPEEVKLANTSGWLEDGVAALERALAAGSGAELHVGSTRVADARGYLVDKAIRAAINALFVKHQVLVSKQDSLELLLARLREVEPVLAGRLAVQLRDDATSVGVGREVIEGIAEWLGQDPQLARRVLPVRQRLRALHFSATPVPRKTTD